ncbi:MAG: KEOPS complex kinase/ATPase Bud32 [Candidatus Nanoarchaeia archaeon]|nr:KEOPS complex kinase/ATPase Bud32 [Candidatus Nanoarchaeia archaeon]
MVTKIICQGAEAKIYLEEDKIIKQRIPKTYRNQILDEKIRYSRNKKEAKILYKAKKLNLNVPKIYNFNEKKQIPQDKDKLILEYINGEKLSDFLDSYSLKKQMNIMKKFGKQVGLLHENDIIHSDLTTSNTILKKNKVYIIDFGLSYISKKIEDKAVDIHLIKQALNAKHYKNYENLYLSFLEGYNPNEKREILNRLEIVEKRGRYKH